MTPEEMAEIVAAVKADLGPSPLAVGGFFQVAAGQTILADHMNTALVNGIPKFANWQARDAQWPSPPLGAFCYIVDYNWLEVYDNAITGGAAAWRVPGSLRMGYSLMGLNQVITSGGSSQLIKLDTANGPGGAANRPGRATWNADGSVTVPLNGTYLLNGSICWPANATGQRTLYLKRYTGGAWSFQGTAGGVNEDNVAGSSALRMGVSAEIACVAGDKVGMLAWQDSGVSLTLVGGADQARLGVHLLGAD